jgi:hypothetical protein
MRWSPKTAFTDVSKCRAFSASNSRANSEPGLLARAITFRAFGASEDATHDPGNTMA